ncbi:hypothetical protein LH935_06795 [Gordonia polyisoprenivorans]|uniref:hypothetical protein n=1 Tax=Gordonia polyisoprenivorans TaxID=84595 RepID=UPI0022346DB4|nr:hypothetical protein LH935_06795 [Gordonia polyisoprenivorans]
MSAQEVIAAHMPYDWCGGMWDCTAPNCDVDTSESENPDQDFAAHVLDALSANGVAVVEKPEPDETEDGVTDWECAPYRISTLEAYPGEVFPAYLGEPEEPLTPQGARELAAALLAAADAAERGES